MKFCIYAADGTGRTDEFVSAFNIRSPQQLSAVLSGESLQIPTSLVREFSPDALSLLEFRGQRDIDISMKMYESHPKLGDTVAGDPVHSQSREIDMTNDAALFCDDHDGLPLYEGRMIDQYDHRAKGYVSGRARAAVWDELKFGTPAKIIQPQWRIMPDAVPAKDVNRVNRFRIGYGWVASPTNERSFIAALIPPATIAGNAVPTIMYSQEYEWMYIPWLATANSFTMDFLVRMKVSLNLTFTLLKSLPFPRPTAPDNLVTRLAPLVLELSCSSVEMNGYWQAMSEIGLVVPPQGLATPVGSNDPIRRLCLRSVIEAIVAHDVFGISRDQLEYVMETFPSVQEKDVEVFGDFRTKLLILTAYERLRDSLPAAVLDDLSRSMQAEVAT